MSTRRQFGRIRKLPSGRWQARYPDGSGRDIAAPMTFISKGDAARFLAQMQADLDRGQWRDPRLGQMTFTAWVEEWLDSNPAKRATTRAREEAVARKAADVLGRLLEQSGELHGGLTTDLPVVS